MSVRACSLAAALAACWSARADGAEAAVRLGWDPFGAGFAFAGVPPPSTNDAGASARWTLAAGEADRNGGGLEALHDGRSPSGEDRPRENFFFAAGSAGGRIVADLGREMAVSQVNSYSWHPGGRGPQVYDLYGAAAAAGADGPAATASWPGGWRLLARVDTRSPGGEGGGQHGASVVAPSGPLGAFRYVLFDVRPTRPDDPFGHTFFSEIDIVESGGPAPAADPALAAGPQPVRVAFEAPDRAFACVVDATAAPDLAAWAERELKPAVLAWYPRLTALLASEGYRPPARLALRFKEDMGGTPASAGGAVVNLNAGWFRKELKREALGCVIHELVHVVQGYGRARRPGAKPAPGWVVEGLADYVRWFLYEPQSRGAEILAGNLGSARYDGSYRVSANFIDWAAREHGRDLVSKLNAAAREGRYDDALWQEWTGQPLLELGEAWLAAQRRRLGR